MHKEKIHNEDYEDEEDENYCPNDENSKEPEQDSSDISLDKENEEREIKNSPSSENEKNQDEDEDSDSSSVFNVENIIGKRTLKGITQYLVKWEGYDQSQATWEPAKGLANVKKEIKKFEETQAQKAQTKKKLKRENKDVPVEELEKVGSLSTDIPRKILRIKKNDNLDIECEVEWCVNENGETPQTSFIKFDTLETTMPLTLTHYLKERLMKEMKGKDK